MMPQTCEDVSALSELSEVINQHIFIQHRLGLIPKGFPGKMF